MAHIANSGQQSIADARGHILYFTYAHTRTYIYIYIIIITIFRSNIQRINYRINRLRSLSLRLIYHSSEIYTICTGIRIHIRVIHIVRIIYCT